jgi:hypothetical protein
MVLYPECLTGFQGILPHSMTPVGSLQLEIERDGQGFTLPSIAWNCYDVLF